MSSLPTVSSVTKKIDSTTLLPNYSYLIVLLTRTKDTVNIDTNTDTYTNSHTNIDTNIDTNTNIDTDTNIDY